MRPSSHAELPRLGDWHDARDLRRIQEKRLPEAVRSAERAPHYQRTLAGIGPVTSVEELDALPMLTKQHLRENYPFGLLAVDREDLATYHESSGTSGRPTSSFFTEDDWYDVVDRFTRSSAGLNSSDTVLVRTPYAMLPTGHQAHLGALHAGATVVPADNRSLVVTHARVVRLLRDLGVSVAWCMPTECLLWAAAAREAGLRPNRDFPELRALMLVGEPLSPARRELIRRVWGGVQIVEDYGSTETGSLAGECSQRRLHLWADRFVPRVLDPETGTSSATGEGVLTLTTLYRRAMPLVRYNTEDRVRITEPDCPCGWALPVLEVLGRDATSPLVGDRRVPQSRVEETVLTCLAEYGVMFWRGRSLGDRLEIEFELPRGRAEEAERSLVQEIRRRLGVPAWAKAVPSGALVPLELLTREPDFVKPKSLFAEDEDWDRAVSYW